MLWRVSVSAIVNDWNKLQHDRQITGVLRDLAAP